MLDANIKTQLKAYLEKLQQPIELIASLDDSAPAQEMLGLLKDIAELSDKVSLREDGDAALRPSFAIGRPGEVARVSFAGLPMGHEFTSLILALLQTGGHPPKVDAAVIEAIKDPKTEAPDNGLNLEENRELATAVDIQIIIPLLLRGLRETMQQRLRPMAR